ncbi:MAG: bifunctional phosphopantothenoylcysteine decarboxylase/phosphopantothenate--cysteine ligase CoaBC [Magnetococcales bacterium]|nr:bifunctional phosphopantothenoylcysteine decarboxylase/phosphopantothenate--cysteine ligase CoaBC [Magnetococcales bacterium]
MGWVWIVSGPVIKRSRLVGFWSNRYIAVAIGGGIAAYKTLELLRLLREAGARVVVIATAAALHFVTPLTLQALSGHLVRSDLFTPNESDGMDHIRLAQEAELLIVAPATADLMARMAGGHGDDLLTTALLARQGPVLLAPAMNSAMWSHPATQRNVAQLQADGIHWVGPEYGALACGDQGQGRMAAAEQILEAGRRLLSPQSWRGRHLLITAGPTQEELDPVRYLSNRSSGRMGWAICHAALRAGAHVTLVHGPVAMPVPWGAEAVAVQSAQQMYEAVLQIWERQEQHALPLSAAIFTAAVADFRPARRQTRKIKKEESGDQTLTRLTLAQNPDILATIAARANRLTQENRPAPIVVGFAAETQTGAESQAALRALGQKKLAHKGCDLLLVNNVWAEGCAFGSPTNQVTLLHRSGHEETWPLLSKEVVGERLLDYLTTLFV